MKDIRDRLEKVIKDEFWTNENRAFMTAYLKNDDYSELEDVLLDHFNAEINSDSITADHAPAALPLARKSAKVKIHSWRYIYYGAAVLLVLFFMAGLSLLKLNEKPVSVERIVTKKNERKHLKLKDGSAVWLNAGSSIIIPGDFAMNTRALSLEGEAYFEIAEMEDVPFTIKTNGLTTKVLGTKFNIRNYREDDFVEVTVVSGKVNVSSPEMSVNLVKDQKSLYYPESGQLKAIVKVNAAAKLAWKSGQLEYHDEPIAQVITDIERKYDIQIELAPSLKACTIYAKFSNEPVTQILEALAMTINAHVDKQGSLYKITGKGCI